MHLMAGFDEGGANCCSHFARVQERDAHATNGRGCF